MSSICFCIADVCKQKCWTWGMPPPHSVGSFRQIIKVTIWGWPHICVYKSQLYIIQVGVYIHIKISYWCNTKSSENKCMYVLRLHLAKVYQPHLSLTWLHGRETLQNVPNSSIEIVWTCPEYKDTKSWRCSYQIASIYQTLPLKPKTRPPGDYWVITIWNLAPKKKLSLPSDQKDPNECQVT